MDTTNIDRLITDRAPVRITFGHLKGRTGVLMSWNLQYDTVRIGFLDKDGRYSGEKTTVSRTGVELAARVNTYLDGDKLSEQLPAPVNTNITPEMIEALATLRTNVRSHETSEKVSQALVILDNAGVFSAIDDATGYDSDPSPDASSQVSEIVQCSHCRGDKEEARKENTRKLIQGHVGLKF